MFGNIARHMCKTRAALPSGQIPRETRFRPAAGPCCLWALWLPAHEALRRKNLPARAPLGYTKPSESHEHTPRFINASFGPISGSRTRPELIDGLRRRGQRFTSSRYLWLEWRRDRFFDRRRHRRRRHFLHRRRIGLDRRRIGLDRGRRGRRRIRSRRRLHRNGWRRGCRFRCRRDAREHRWFLLRRFPLRRFPQRRACHRRQRTGRRAKRNRRRRCRSWWFRRDGRNRFVERRRYSRVVLGRRSERLRNRRRLRRRHVPEVRGRHEMRTPLGLRQWAMRGSRHANLRE